MNLNIIIASNYFSQNLADLYVCDGHKIYYRVRSRSKLLKAIRLTSIICISWIAKLAPKFGCILYLPHSYGRFGLIKKYCNYDQLVIIEDGIALMSARSFQKNYIYNCFKDKKCDVVVACEDHAVESYDAPDVKVIPRHNVMKKMLSEYKGQAKLKITTSCALIIDNGSWSAAQIEEIRVQIKTKFDTDCLVILHPSRKADLIGCIRLDEPVEIAWYQNKRKLTMIVTAFSTAAVNIKAFSPDVPIVFIYPDARFHRNRILELGSDVIDLETQ